MAFLDSFRIDKTNINALVQSIERSLHLIYKNRFSIKQYQAPPKIGLNLFKKSRRTLPLCVRRRLRLVYPRRPEVILGALQGVQGVPPSVRPTRTKFDYDHGNITYQMFSSASAGVKILCRFFSDFLARARKTWIPKSVVFAYEGVPAHLDLAITAPYVHSLCFPLDIVGKDLSCLKATPKADISSSEI